MHTENKYEEMLIKEIRGLPKISQYKIVQMLRTLRHRKRISRAHIPKSCYANIIVRII